MIILFYIIYLRDVQLIIIENIFTLKILYINYINTFNALIQAVEEFIGCLDNPEAKKKKIIIVSKYIKYSYRYGKCVQ